MIHTQSNSNSSRTSHFRTLILYQCSIIAHCKRKNYIGTSSNSPMSCAHMPVYLKTTHPRHTVKNTESSPQYCALTTMTASCIEIQKSWIFQGFKRKCYSHEALRTFYFAVIENLRQPLFLDNDSPTQTYGDSVFCRIAYFRDEHFDPLFPAPLRKSPPA